MNKTLKKLHLWVAIPFGIIISIICITGALLLFEDEITESCNRHVYFNEASGTPLTIAELMPKVQAEIPADTEITGITISADSHRNYRFALSKPRKAAVMVNQFTGEVTGKAERTEFFAFVFKLHRWLLNTMQEGQSIWWGRLIIGITTLAFAFLLITGLFIWWPKSLTMAKNRFGFVLSKGARRFFYDLHVSGGFYALIILLSLALTGLTWSFEWYHDGFYSLFGAKKETKEMAQAKPSDKKPNDKKSDEKGEKPAPDYAAWQRAYDNVHRITPDASSITLSDGSVSVPANKCWGNQFATNSYKFDATTGELGAAKLYADSDASTKIGGWIKTIHFARWGGWFSKILALISVILGFTLPLTGYYLWSKRTFLNPKKK